MADIDQESVNRLVTAAKAAAASHDTTPAPGSAEPLQAAAKDASADERSAAAKELGADDDRGGLEALHAALRALDIEPS